MIKAFIIQYKWWIIGILVLIIGYILYKRYTRTITLSEGYSGEVPSQSVVSSVASTWRGDTFPLGKGSSGTRVKAVQRAVNEMDDAGIAVDGRWGPITEDAVKRLVQNYFLENFTWGTGGSGSWASAAVNQAVSVMSSIIDDGRVIIDKNQYDVLFKGYEV